MNTRLFVVVGGLLLCLGSYFFAASVAKTLADSPLEQEQWAFTLGLSFILTIAAATGALVVYMRIRERAGETATQGTSSPLIKIPKATLALLGIAGTIAFVVFLTNLIPESGPSKEKAELAARQFVRANLKDPSSAGFGWDTPTIRENDDGSYTIIGKVTSKNSFNANVTNIYTCQVYFSQGEWKLEDIAFLER
jgi:hypothetical protein